jgi:hypothetical protein
MAHLSASLKAKFCIPDPRIIHFVSSVLLGIGALTLQKEVSDIPVHSRDVTYQTFPGREKFNYSRPGRVWQVTSRLGTEMSLASFYVVSS